MTADKKVTTGANDRPKSDSIAQTAPGIPDDSGAVVDAEEGQLDAMRAALGLDGTEDADADRSPARQKDHQRDDPEDKRGSVEGAEEIDGAEADGDTYD
jgi:hypothetical protein